MADAQVSRADLDVRRRRLLFRCWHRGTREMDLIMGPFAEAELASLEEAEIDAFECLIEMPDDDLFSWITRRAAPAEHATPLFAKLVAFHSRPKAYRL
jgi:antitoxin CptB